MESVKSFIVVFLWCPCFSAFLLLALFFQRWLGLLTNFSRPRNALTVQKGWEKRPSGVHAVGVP